MLKTLHESDQQLQRYSRLNQSTLLVFILQVKSHPKKNHKNTNTMFYGGVSVGSIPMKALK